MMKQKPYRIAVCWLRRDLRDYDHAALARATGLAEQVIPLFVFDREILDTLPDRADKRVSFIWHSLIQLKTAIRRHGSDVWLRHGRATEVLPQFVRETGADLVVCARDYEPGAVRRDAVVASALGQQGVAFEQVKDHVVFERDDVLNRSGRPYTVFTPYSRAWLERLAQTLLPAEVPDWSALQSGQDEQIGCLADIGFAESVLNDVVPGMAGAAEQVRVFSRSVGEYPSTRDFPALDSTSHLAVHLRFGTVSIRQLVNWARQMGSEGASAWLRALIWRDFFFMLLHHFPQVEHKAFHPEYDDLKWDERPEWFDRWRMGQTGYPLVDAGMRQLNQTGLMHNRVRMVVASFLTKDLGLNWRLGEHYFADRLLDYDLAANNGNWQWAASTGCDAQPWFRIFNPVTQSEKFDARGAYIRQWLPELADVPDKYIHAPWTMPALQQQLAHCVIGRDYPLPIVDHALARERSLARYKAVKKDVNDA